MGLHGNQIDSHGRGDGGKRDSIRGDLTLAVVLLVVSLSDASLDERRERDEQGEGDGRGEHSGTEKKEGREEVGEGWRCEREREQQKEGATEKGLVLGLIVTRFSKGKLSGSALKTRY